MNATKIADDISSAQKLAQSAWNRARKVDNFTKRLNTTIFTIQEMIATADFRSEAPGNEAPVRRDISNLRVEEISSEVAGIVDRLTRLEGDLTETNSFVYDVLLDDLNKKVDELEQATSLGSATNLNISWLMMVGQKVGFWLVFLMVGFWLVFWLVFGWFFGWFFKALR
jgi:hypothetical protein